MNSVAQLIFNEMSASNIIVDYFLYLISVKQTVHRYGNKSLEVTNKANKFYFGALNGWL